MKDRHEPGGPPRIARAIGERLTYANVMATAAVFIALGGSAWAIAANSVGTKELKNNAVKTKKVANGAIKTLKIANGAVTEQKLAAGAGGVEASRVKALEDEVASLQALLAGVSRTEVDGNDTLRFTAMNLQLVNGTATTDGTPNALGNLIIGYSEQRVPPATRTGSHYLVIGDRHEWTAFGGILAGLHNAAGGDWASVSGGRFNTASGNWASVSGGYSNTASGSESSVSGGYNNTASDFDSSVSGGINNTASGLQSSVSGGAGNTASGAFSSILGGLSQTVSSQVSCHPTC